MVQGRAVGVGELSRAFGGREAVVVERVWVGTDVAAVCAVAVCEVVERRAVDGRAGERDGGRHGRLRLCWVRVQLRRGLRGGNVRHLRVPAVRVAVAVRVRGVVRRSLGHLDLGQQMACLGRRSSIGRMHRYRRRVRRRVEHGLRGREGQAVPDVAKRRRERVELEPERVRGGHRVAGRGVEGKSVGILGAVNTEESLGAGRGLGRSKIALTYLSARPPPLSISISALLSKPKKQSLSRP